LTRGGGEQHSDQSTPTEITRRHKGQQVRDSAKAAEGLKEKKKKGSNLGQSTEQSIPMGRKKKDQGGGRGWGSLKKETARKHGRTP